MKSMINSEKMIYENSNQKQGVIELSKLGVVIKNPKVTFKRIADDEYTHRWDILLNGEPTGVYAKGQRAFDYDLIETTSTNYTELYVNRLAGHDYMREAKLSVMTYLRVRRSIE